VAYNKPHISFSELKDWNKCAYYHKKSWIDKVVPFIGSEHTAFGTAMHEVCEKKLLKESNDDIEVFNLSFEKEIEKLLINNIDLSQKLVDEMVEAAPKIIPELEPSLGKYFGDYEVFACEDYLYENIEGHDLKFKGYIDVVIRVGDKYHIVDYKTTSWGWDSRRRTERIVTYQLTLYKHFFCLKYGIDPANVENHFALLKRTAKKNRVELFRVTSGNKKTNNALKLLNQAIYNIKKGVTIKNRLNCTKPFECKLYKTKHCR